MARGFTLIESMIALIIFALIVQAVWSSLHLVTVGDRVADREAARALEEARAMELLLRDLRSTCTDVQAEDGPLPGERTYRFRRYVLDGTHRLHDVDVAWSLKAGNRIVRKLGDEAPQSFSFGLDMDRTNRPFQFRLQRVDRPDWLKGRPDAPAK